VAEADAPLERSPGAWKRPAIGLCIVVAVLLGGVALLAGLTSWDPSKPFERNAPEVDAAIAAMEGEEPQRAADLLQNYLQTGPCSDEGIGLPDAVRDKYNASFDFGLALFQLAESYGHRFGEEPMPAPSGMPMAPPNQEPPADDEKATQRKQTAACALAIVNAIASDPEIPIDLRARAFYLEGNLHFMQEDYEKAVESYDLSLALQPGFKPPEEGQEPQGPPKDTIGADAAWNRSIALWRQQEVEKQNPPPPEPQPDDENQSQDQPDEGDEQKDEGDEKEDEGDEQKDEGDEKEDEGDEQKDEGEQPAKPEEQQANEGADEGIDESGEEEGPPASLEALLDEFESAPTYQEEAAKRRGNNVRRRRRVMEDK